MANINIDNNGSVTGRVAKTKRFDNSDGSVKLYITVMVDRDYTDRETGQRPSDGIPVEVFIPKGQDFEKTPYASIVKGSPVTISYEVRENRYTDSEGQRHYGIVLRATGIKHRETKAQGQARLARVLSDAETENAELRAEVQNQAAPADQADVAVEEPTPY